MSQQRVYSASLALIVATGLAVSAASATSCFEARTAGLVGLSSTEDRYDPDTGRDNLNYAPSRVVDYDHMKLVVDIPDMNSPALTATEELTFTPLGADLAVLTLNAENFDLGEITGTGGAEVADVSYDGHTIQIKFASPIPAGKAAGVRLAYTIENPVDGLFWTPESDAWAGRPAQIHTQGEPETNRYWFASHDYPNDRMTTEITATVPEGFLVSSNGHLVDQNTRRGRTTFHWLQDKPHVSYLVSLIVGKFDVVDVGTDQLPMPVYVPPGKGDLVKDTYGRTADMIRVFEDRFDEPYPWDRYAQLVVWNFGAGGMENTSATTMYDTAIYDAKDLRDGDLEGLISHELGHQWFGDLITCNRWADLWLNEGFATYMTAVWYEARDGYDAGYLRQALVNFDRVTRADALDPDDERAGRRPAMVSRIYDNPDEVFRRRANPYPKGSSILHMLRMKLGDETFFRGIAEYIDRRKFNTAETTDLRRTLEDVSGQSLDQFFQQWAYRPGFPDLHVSAAFDLSTSELGVSVEQRQRIDGFVPAFVFDLPIEITLADGSTRTITIPMSTRRAERTVVLDGEPAMVVVDPSLSVLSTRELDEPEEWLIAQAESGPTTPSRILAIRALAGGSDAAGDALTAIFFDQHNNRHVRAAAADALGDHDAFNALLSVAQDKREEPRVRAAAIGALRDAEADSDDALTACRKLAVDRAAPYGVQAGALRWLGAVGEEKDQPILAKALTVDSRDDTVRASAIRAIRDLEAPGALELIIPYTREGNLSRTRPAAIAAVGDLAEQDPEAAYDAIVPILDDQHEDRARTTAARTLVKIKDDRGVAVLRRIARIHPKPAFRDLCGTMADRLGAAARADDNDADTATLERIESLERQLEELQAQIGDED